MKKISLAFLLLFLLSCTKAQLTTDGTQNTLSRYSYYLTASSNTRIYWKDSGLGTFISQLAPEGGELVLPNSLLTGDYGNRQEESTPYPLSLVAKVYVPDHPSGDFYFETPILGPRASVTNVTTALSWYLRWAFYGKSIRMSKATFDKISLNIEVLCNECRNKTNSEVLSLIRGSQSMSEQIRTMVASENPTINLAGGWTNPSPTWAWSDPILSLHGSGAKTAKETDSISMSALYIDPLRSTEKIVPLSWTHTFQSTSSTINDSLITYVFSYDESGTHTFRPQFASGIPDEGITYQLTIDDVNRNPLCNGPINIVMRANTLNSVNLSNLCFDPDADNTSLTFAQSAGPSGFAITAIGIAKWLPPPSADQSVYSVPFAFTISDAKLGMSSQSGTVTVSIDHAPSFTSIQPHYSFTEGLPKTFTVTAQDSDGDPLTLTLKSDTPLRSGFPDGAGSLAQIVRTGSNGNYSFQVTFTPSYLQTVGGDGTMSVHFTLGYDNASGNFDPTLKFDDRVVSFQIANADDPPQWDIQPVDITATEGVDFGGILIGHATDPTPNPTAVKYIVTNHDETHCQWAADLTVTTDGAGNAYLHGAPAYFTNENCLFAITATDANSLSSESSIFKVTTANINQPIVVLPTALTVVTGQEGKSMNLPLTDIFDDPDLDTIPFDDREYLTYDCRVDSDGDGIYESTCISKNLNFTLSPKNLLGSWTPPAFSAGTYHLQLAVTDIGGVTASARFDLVVEEYATAMTLTTVYGGTEVTAVSVAEGSATPLVLRATAASARAIDNYGFTVNTPTCTVLGGSGNCSVSLITSPGSLSSTGTTDFVFTLKPNYNDADSAFPLDSKKYIVSFYAQKTDDPTVYMQQSLSVTVTNTNRAPTAIGLTKGSFGCTGSSENSNSDAFTVCVDASQDKKSGNTWSKNYSVPLSAVDPDTTNDSYSYSFTETVVPGSVVDAAWNFKLPACMNAGTGTVSRTYNLNLSDGRGGTVSRQVILKILKASASSSCL